jgi:hypothetical protein
MFSLNRVLGLIIFLQVSINQLVQQIRYQGDKDEKEFPH